jgi:hypothetical protein
MTNPDAVTFARMFLTRMLSISNEMLGQAWTHESPAVLRARVKRMATDTAYQCGVHLDAADALVTYALATLVIDGQSLDDVAENGLRGTSDYDPTRRFNPDRNTNR